MSTSDKRDIEITPADFPGGIDPEWRQFVSRLMSGYETAHRRLLDGYDILAQRLKSSESAVTAALELQLKMTQEYEQLMSLRHERELAAERSRARLEAFNTLTRDARALLPIAAKKLLGVPLTGNDSHGLQDLLASLSGEQIDAIVTEGKIELTHAQRQALVQVLGSLADKEQVANAAE